MTDALEEDVCCGCGRPLDKGEADDCEYCGIGPLCDDCYRLDHGVGCPEFEEEDTDD